MSKKKTQKYKKKKRLPFWLKGVIAFFVIVLIAGGVIAWQLYNAIYQPNVFLGERETTHIYIPTGSDFTDVKNILYEKGMIINSNTFEWIAEKKNYKNHVYPGRYLISSDMGNNDLINLLRSGKQDPVMVTFNNIRLKEELAGEVSFFLEADSVEVLRLLNDQNYLSQFGLTPETSKTLFIPNTYEFFWDTDAKELMQRMVREHKKFWNDERIAKANQINLKPAEVATLASIVQQETAKQDEFGKIAGVYINRLKIGMPLQADPTVIFAVGDFSIRRVLNRHLEVNSPYNTYKNKGLPPGPIALPEPQVIDGVLNYHDHNYLYFCAKEDFSGYHAFATNYRDHINNARRYQRALNQRRIMR